MSSDEAGAPDAAPPSMASCSVCRDSIGEDSEILATVCGHVFHTRCITEWLKQSPTCPQCRRKVRKLVAGDSGSELRRIYLSFGSPGEGEDEAGHEAEGLAELRKRLAASAEEAESAKKQLKRLERLDARRRRDLTDRQRQINMVSMQLETCQESMAQQVDENKQLLQLLAHEQVSQAELLRLREQVAELDERRSRHSAEEGRVREEALRLQAENTDLRARLDETEREAEKLADALESERGAYADLTDQLLAAEAASFDLSKRLTSGHADFSRLASRLRSSERAVAQLNQSFLALGLQQGPVLTAEAQQFASLPVRQAAAAPDAAEFADTATVQLGQPQSICF